MYLAEDRILCFELVANGWLLHCCKEAVAETDPPCTLTNLLSQRRRWMNGSFFAQCYGLVRTPYHLLGQSSHTPQQKFIFFLQFFDLSGSENWTTVPSLPCQSRTLSVLPLPGARPGARQLPILASSSLFKKKK